MCPLFGGSTVYQVEAIEFVLETSGKIISGALKRKETRSSYSRLLSKATPNYYTLV